MRYKSTVGVVVPALNEEDGIGRVLSMIPSWVDEVIVVDNGSTDGTRAKATEHGARVVSESRRGYGSACMAGVRALAHAEIVVFLDGDYSDFPEEMHMLVDPIAEARADIVIGSRIRGRLEPGALPLQSLLGNIIACRIIRLFWGSEFTDLGPFRAIRASTLDSFEMRDPDYGWTVEMQIKAVRKCVRMLEVPVSYRPRLGKSKVSGTAGGAFAAGAKILLTIFRAVLASNTRRRTLQRRPHVELSPHDESEAEGTASRAPRP